jgi:hypothetical protein
MHVVCLRLGPRLDPRNRPAAAAGLPILRLALAELERHYRMPLG